MAINEKCPFEDESYNYEIHFKNGETFTFTCDVDINFHNIKTPGVMAFDDLFINLNEILYISKKEA